MHYYQHHIGDFIKDTSFLNNEESMVYLKLLWLYYDTEQPLPNDRNLLAIKTDTRDRPTLLHDILPLFFTLTEDGWRHSRCDTEIAKYQEKSEQASRAGRASAERRANARLTDVQPTINHKPITINQVNTNICPPNGVPEGLPNCDHDAVIALYHQFLPTLRRVEVWNDTRKGYLRQRWREVAEDLSKTKKATGQDVLTWFTDFFQHIGTSKFLTGRVNSKDGRAFLADLEWILKPSNFAKIVEGKYHGTN
jgi:uncharacterized protein YdaU (DUF1376 family)